MILRLIMLYHLYPILCINYTNVRYYLQNIWILLIDRQILSYKFIYVYVLVTLSIECFSLCMFHDLIHEYDRKYYIFIYQNFSG